MVISVDVTVQLSMEMSVRPCQYLVFSTVVSSNDRYPREACDVWRCLCNILPYIENFTRGINFR